MTAPEKNKRFPSIYKDKKQRQQLALFFYDCIKFKRYPENPHGHQEITASIPLQSVRSPKQQPHRLPRYPNGCYGLPLQSGRN